MIRILLTVLIVPAFLGGCAPPGSGDSSAQAEGERVYRAGTTPEQTVEQFIEAQREGNNEALRVTIYPEDSQFEVDEPVEIKVFQILRKKELTAEEAATFTTGPPRREGDVMLEVYEEYAQGRTSRNEYFLRNYNGEWRIYAMTFEP